jgi:DNA-binding CsgD family transcriptional regulator
MSGAETASTEDVVRILVKRSLANNQYRNYGQQDPRTEEILLDIEVDGARYLLVRLPQSRSATPPLSPREQEIVRMVSQGFPNKVIAGVLNISSWTVSTHLRRIFAKLGVTSRAAMVAQILEVRTLREQLNARGAMRERSVEAERRAG